MACMQCGILYKFKNESESRMTMVYADSEKEAKKKFLNRYILYKNPPEVLKVECINLGHFD